MNYLQPQYTVNKVDCLKVVKKHSRHRINAISNQLYGSLSRTDSPFPKRSTPGLVELLKSLNSEKKRWGEVATEKQELNSCNINSCCG